APAPAPAASYTLSLHDALPISKPVTWGANGVELSAVPFQGFRVTFTIEYDHPLIGCQTRTVDVTADSFLKEIAPARTFVLEETRSEEHTSELQSRGHLVCRLLL